jgi:hypothetical protein
MRTATVLLGLMLSMAVLLADGAGAAADDAGSGSGAHILFVSYPSIGAVQTLLVLARELEARGHRITFAVTDDYPAPLPASSRTFAMASAGPPPTVNTVTALTGFAAVKHSLLSLFGSAPNARHMQRISSYHLAMGQHFLRGIRKEQSRTADAAAAAAASEQEADDSGEAAEGLRRGALFPEVSGWSTVTAVVCDAETLVGLDLSERLRVPLIAVSSGSVAANPVYSALYSWDLTHDVPVRGALLPFSPRGMSYADTVRNFIATELVRPTITTHPHTPPHVRLTCARAVWACFWPVVL